MTASETEVQVGAQGRVVRPAALRKALQLKPGDRLIARRVNDTLVFERRETVERRLRERFRHVPDSVRLSDELIAERRAEARSVGVEGAVWDMIPVPWACGKRGL